MVFVLEYGWLDDIEPEGNHRPHVRKKMANDVLERWLSD